MMVLFPQLAMRGNKCCTSQSKIPTASSKEACRACRACNILIVDTAVARAIFLIPSSR